MQIGAGVLKDIDIGIQRSHCKWDTELLILALSGVTCIINLFDTEFTDLFKTKRLIIPNNTQINADILKIKALGSQT